MEIHRLRSYQDYIAHATKDAESQNAHDAFLSSITPTESGMFGVPGYSYTANTETTFLARCDVVAGIPQVNWRETLQCPITLLSNRARAAVHLLDSEIGPTAGANIYLTEQLSQLHQFLANRYDNVVGSEFLGVSVPLGASNEGGVRNEDICRLTFADQSFDIVLSFDVLEHVPDYRTGFAECARILRKGGKMLWSVPFVQHEPNNIVRAVVDHGEIVHVLTPEYHGDPLSSDGILCFTHFGWDMLDQVREAGFSDAYAIKYRSLKYGYLGGGQYVFVAVK